MGECSGGSGRWLAWSASPSLPASSWLSGSCRLRIREGGSVKAVQRSLGHKSVVMTLDRYGHLWPDELEDLADRLDRARAAAVAPSTRLSAARPLSS